MNVGDIREGKKRESRATYKGIYSGGRTYGLLCFDHSNAKRLQLWIWNTYIYWEIRRKKDSMNYRYHIVRELGISELSRGRT